MRTIKTKNRKLKRRAIEARRLIAYLNPKSIISEQFRTVRTNIKYSLPNKTIKKILVTSSIPNEGKSTNAANLAVVFAQEGKKVLLVDADMRKPTLHFTFGVLNTGGLSTVLTKHDDFSLVVRYTSIDNLDILPSGYIPPNPSELLSSENMDEFIRNVENKYDIIIFDAPPVLSVTDAQILSSKCDGSLLIVGLGNVEKSDLKKTKDLLEASQGKILGVILNKYKMNRTKHYYY